RAQGVAQTEAGTRLMIAFGSSITAPDVYRDCAEKGIRLATEPDSKVMPHAAAGSIFRSYNLLLEKAAELTDLEALVLIHQDAEITDADFCAKLRRALEDPDVGVVGCVGAIGVRSIAWWEGSVTWASFIHRYGELGGGDLPAFSWNGSEMPAYAKLGEVDTVDGFVLGLSPWVVRNVRFDESLGLLHGYDLDFCLQVREAGKKVVTADFKVIHHHSLDLVSDPETWVEAHMRVAEKWDGKMPGVGQAGGDWKQRARRAEAEAAAARAQAVSNQLKADARALQLQREFEEVTNSTSWKLTLPLRRGNLWRKSLAKRRWRDGSGG
ncbi:MAG TPA: glycosyltransferase, partial [Thermoleophilaceae bacterium]|nr:glycosyltransferase [Thermoleophilaceae bacterium]